MTDRQKALEWWHSLTDLTKSAYIVVNTGLGIEDIWRNEFPREKETKNPFRQTMEELIEENQQLKEALQRIADTFDNKEDLAGLIARKTLDRFK